MSSFIATPTLSLPNIEGYAIVTVVAVVAQVALYEQWRWWSSRSRSKCRDKINRNFVAWSIYTKKNNKKTEEHFAVDASFITIINDDH